VIEFGWGEWGLRERQTWLAVLLVLAIGLNAVAFLGYWSGDNAIVLVRWYNQIIIDGFSRPIGNYSPPYLYLLAGLTPFDGSIPDMALIKALSVLGAIWVAFASYRLLKIQSAYPEFGFATLALPSVVLNASALGQADTFWVASCILALAAAIRRNYLWVAIWSGLAFAFKAQAVFFAPFVILLFWARRVRPVLWAVPPAVYVLACIPAWLAGWPAWDLTTIYLRQAQWQPQDYVFVSNSASWWTWFGFIAPSVAARSFGIGFVAAVAATLAYWRFVSVGSPRTLMIAAVLSAAGLPFLLPGMHERFFILADVLAFLYTVSFPSRRAAVAAASMQVASAFPVIVFAFRLEPWELVAPAFGIIAMALFWQELTESVAESAGEASTVR
jgi:Gpi18-like mannosyltransferase